MEANPFYTNDKYSTAEEESLLLKRLTALRKQLEDDEPNLHKTTYNTKENVITNKNVMTSKFKYRKINNCNNVNKFLSTKIDNRNFTEKQSKIKQNNLLTITKNISEVNARINSLHLTPDKSKTGIIKQSNEIRNNSKSAEKYNSEINEILKNSHIENCKVLLNENSHKTSGVSQTLLSIDKYMINVQGYLTSSKYVVNKEDVSNLSSSQTDILTNNQVKNVHVNRKFQNQLMSKNLLNSNLKSASKSLVSIKKSTNINKKKRLFGKLNESPNLVKIGNTKLIRQSLFRNKWKINNKLNEAENNIVERKPLSALQCPSSNTLIRSYNKTKWTKNTNPTLAQTALKPKLSNSSNINKLKWTRPNILLVNNVKNNYPIVPKSDKLILFGKNKIIRQSLINSVQSNTRKYLLKHFSHRFALIRKLQQKNNVPKVKNLTTSKEYVKSNLLLKKSVNKPFEIKRNGKKTYSTYSYVNPKLRSKINNPFSLGKTESSKIKLPQLINISKNKSQQNFKLINNDKNKNQHLSLTNIKTPERLRSKKVFTKQLCLVFNRFGICSKLNQGNCDKRHYKKFITLCTKFLTGECFHENCTLSHNIVEEKIPFCKHYLNSVCVKLNCPYLHEYRDTSSPICKNFLHGFCTQGKKCSKKHLNVCPIFETKNTCPHGQKCLYPHIQCEEKNTVDVEINEPRYFEITVPNYEKSNENKSTHIVPKRHAPLTDLPSYIPLKIQ